MDQKTDLEGVVHTMSQIKEFVQKTEAVLQDFEELSAHYDNYKQDKELPYMNKYCGEKSAGLYASVASGEVIFSSKDKF